MRKFATARGMERRPLSTSVSCPSCGPRWVLALSGAIQAARRTPRSRAIVGGRVDRKWQALDPAVMPLGANAFWQVRVATAK